MPLRVRSSAYILAAAGAVACASKIKLHHLDPAPTVVKNYTIGQVQTVRVGDPIVRVRQATEVPTFIAQYDYKSQGIRIARGTVFFAVDSTPSGNLLVSDCAALEYIKLIVSPDASQLWITDGRRSEPLKPARPEPLFKRLTVIGNQPGAFAAELIYSGVAGKVVRAVYREYVDDMARPAFSQELQYDLGVDRTIAYKSLRMRVDEASNAGIRYAVVSDDSLPWLPTPKAASACGRAAP
jgi:hypothetical protein